MSDNNIYNLPTDSIRKVARWYDMQRAAGKVVQPWELEQAWKGVMDPVAREAVENEKFTQALQQNQKFFDEKMALNKKAQQSADWGSLLGGLSNLGMTYLGYNKVKP